MARPIAILKALAIPGYQVPFGSREMPVPYGWGTGGVQVYIDANANNHFDSGEPNTTSPTSVR